MERCTPIDNYYVAGRTPERYKIPLDELITIRLALEAWERQIIEDGDYKEDAVMEQELATTRRLIREIEAEEQRLVRFA